VSRTHVAQKPNGTEQIRKINERTLTLKASTLNFSAVISAIGENVIRVLRRQAASTHFIVFGLTITGIEPTIDRNQ
jgi:phosphosulfolactate phosphohydrolase-like enzyme